MAHRLLVDPSEQWGLVEVRKAVQILDTARQIRALKKKFLRLQEQGASRKKLGEIRQRLSVLQRRPAQGSFTRSVAREVRRWFRSLSSEKLEYYALMFSLEPWRELADLVHPSAEDFQLPYFLGLVFGETPPKASLVSAGRSLREDNLLETLEHWELPYSFVRTRFASLPLQARLDVARTAPLKHLLWFLNELSSEDVLRMLQWRLSRGEIPELQYGTLMEILMRLRAQGGLELTPLVKLAAQRQQELALWLEPPVLILGDASASMKVAIRVATILGSLLSTLTDAELRFFRDEEVKFEALPSGIVELLDFAEKMEAAGDTCPAAAFVDILNHKQELGTLLLVTDEKENATFRGFSMVDLIAAYRKQVGPLFVSLLSFTDKEPVGPMAAELQQRKIPFSYHRLGARHPDLRKLEPLLATLSVRSQRFSETLKEGVHLLKTAGAEAVEAWLEQPLSTLGVKKEPLSESVVSPPVLPVSGSDLLVTVGAVGGGDFFQTGGLPPTSPSNPAFPASVLSEGSAIRGRYEVEGVLGMGGMGIVYKVRDRLRQRSLALKMLHPQIAAQGPERLAQELAIQETLHHEGVVRTYDLDMDAALGQLFFTMDYIEGTSLEVVLERALQQQQVPLFSMETVRSWFSQLVETLSYAHSRKVIHRDLKPSNILFTRDGELKLLDFGIARQVGTATSLHTGGVGTPLYMAPEQWQRNPVLTPAVDQYALAVLLYQWLTGAPALVGRMPGPWEWLASQGIEPLFAQELDDVVLKALDALPQRRFADVRQFGEAVLSLL